MKKQIIKLFLLVAILFVVPFTVVKADSFKAKITFNVIDSYTNEVLKSYDLSKNSGKTIKLDQVYTSSNTYYTGFNYTAMGVTNKTKDRVFDFTNWLDEEGTVIGSESYTVPESISTVVKSLEETTDGKRSLVVSLNSISGLTEDVEYTINVYSKLTEFVEPQLTAIFTDNVSTGSGSWSGSSYSYTKTLKDPERGTPKDHYNFLYWKFDDESKYTDDTVKYYDNDKVSIKLTKAEIGSGFADTFHAYAWWQPSVTLNLYDGNKLLSSEESFEGVVNKITSLERYGYNFLGWVNEDGELVTETEFAAPDITTENNTAVTINLYAKWEKKISKVIVKYIDTDTKETIAEDVEITGAVDDEYETTEKEIENYELVVVPENSTGKITEEPIEVVYEYQFVMGQGEDKEEEDTEEIVNTGSEVNVTLMSAVTIIISALSLSLISKKRNN